MRAIALRLVVLWGWRRALVAMLAGAASVLALAPFHFFPVLFVTLPMLVFLLDGVGEDGGESSFAAGLARLGAAAFVGWCFGFGYFLAGLYWIGFAFLVEQDVFGWLLPFAVVAMPAGLALFTAAGTAFAVKLWSPGQWRILALATGLAASDWLRGHVFTGFPWNAFGQAFGGLEVTMQAASVVGLYGMSLAVILIAAAPAALVSDNDTVRPRGVAVVAAIVAAAVLAGGFWRIPAEPVATVDGVRLRIVQPNVAQKDKWKPENRMRIFGEYLSMSDEATSPTTSGMADVTHVIWPESAVPVLFEEDEQARAAIAALLPPGTMLITGALRREPVPPANGGKSEAYNSIMALDDEGRIVSIYDKVQLVPFGEFLPFQQLLERVGLEQLTRIRGGFAAGAARPLLNLPGLPPFLPLICYEIIFSGDLIPPGERPQWLLNVTNDAWFGDSSGPRQHLDQARIRAVEEGLPVIRAANTGISAVIDPYGRVQARIELNQRGILDTQLPVDLPATIFSRYGNLIFALLMVASFVFALLGKMQSIKKSLVNTQRVQRHG